MSESHEGILDRTPTTEIRDIWSWKPRKYRVRAVVLLIVNILLFAGLGCFAYWLRTGEFLAPASDDYWGLLVRTFMPRGDATLANFVLFPIRLDRVPMNGVVVGLLLAALVSIPILISILYRFPCCIPFLLIVCFLAVMPWLALNLTLACVLASVRPFRFKFRYASALLGLVLVMLYFYGASRQSAMPLDPVRPMERIKFMAPWVLATIASCVIMGIVLLLARLVNYRPGVVAPLLLICFVLPVAVFENQVGRDELYYRLLEDRYLKKFSDRDVSQWFEQLARKVWASKEEPRPPFETIKNNVEMRLALELLSEAEEDRRTVFAADREQIVRDADWFLRYFPYSRYAANVLYIKGQTLDMRVDMSAFGKDKKLRFYADFPSSQSIRSWEMTRANVPDSSIAAVGRYKMAMFAARDGRMNEALEMLDELLAAVEQKKSTDKDTARPNESVASLLEPEPVESGLDIQLETTVFEARRFAELLKNNRNDPRYANRPLCGSLPGEPRQLGLLELDPHHPQYTSNLQRIQRAYPGCLLGDNVSLRVALAAQEIEQRVIELESCIENYPKGDAIAEARLRLGTSYQDMGRIDEAKAILEQLLQENPNSLWVQAARDRLRSIGPVAGEAAK